MTAGMSASQIAADLGGVTRNGVIGKIHRMNLSNRKIKAPTGAVAGPKPTRMSGVFNERRAAELARPPQVKTVVDKRVKIRRNASRSQEVEILGATEITDLAPDTSEFACTIIELKTDMCRWPLSADIRAMLYCGAPCVGSWCARHRNIVFNRPERRER